MRSSAISSRAPGTATRRSGPSGGPRARPASGVRRRRKTFTARRPDASAPQSLGPHRRCFDRHAARAPHQIEFEIDILGCAQGIGDGAHSEQAVTQPPLQRSERLPFKAIEWISRRVALGDRGAGELLAPVVVVTLCTREIELSLALREQLAAGLQEGLGALVVRDFDRHAVRLAPDIGREREQLLALERKRRRSLLLRAADIDLLLEIDRAPARGIEGWMAGRHAFHARSRVAVAIGA